MVRLGSTWRWSPGGAWCCPAGRRVYPDGCPAWPPAAPPAPRSPVQAEAELKPYLLSGGQHWRPACTASCLAAHLLHSVPDQNTQNKSQLMLLRTGTPRVFCVKPWMPSSSRTQLFSLCFITRWPGLTAASHCEADAVDKSQSATCVTATPCQADSHHSSPLLCTGDQREYDMNIQDWLNLNQTKPNQSWPHSIRINQTN